MESAHALLADETSLCTLQIKNLRPTNTLSHRGEPTEYQDSAHTFASKEASKSLTRAFLANMLLQEGMALLPLYWA